MKIYLAGPCDIEHRTIMVKISKLLRDSSHEVFCPWELKIENAWDKSQEQWAREVFEADIKAIQECDVFFMISQGRESTAGTNWENGYAYALNKHIIVIQITDKPTSLMTYSSASYFYHCTQNNLSNIINYIINDWSFYNNVYCGKNETYYHCKTILT